MVELQASKKVCQKKAKVGTRVMDGSVVKMLAVWKRKAASVGKHFAPLSEYPANLSLPSPEHELERLEPSLAAQGDKNQSHTVGFFLLLVL